MKTKKYATNEERTILTALIVHDIVLSAVSQGLAKEKRPFNSRWSNVVAKWCFEYYAKYQHAPRQHIQGLFDDYAAQTQDQEAVGLIDSFLSGLSQDYKNLAKEMNERCVIDMASAYFEKIKLGRLAAAIQEAVERNNLEEARVAESEYSSIDFSANAYSNPFDEEVIKRTFLRSEEDTSLIQFPGALKQFLSPYFAREGFISLVGPIKRGKSFWLGEIVAQALRQRRRVLYFFFGDMSEEEANKRLYCRIARLPLVAEDLIIPIDLKIRDRLPEVETVVRSFSAITPKKIRRVAEKLRMRTGAKEIRLKVLGDGGKMITAGRIEQDVKNFVKQGWAPDVVVIDYADLLAPEPHTQKLDLRHQIDATWMILRRIGLQSHCLVVTATQAAKTAYTSWLIHKGDFSEDNRKNAHVTGMLGLNQTDEEKAVGVYRLNWVALRSGRWTESQVVWTAGNLGIASPCLISTFA